MATSDWAKELLDLCPESITIEPALAYDMYNKPTYGPPTSFRGRVSYKTQLITSGVTNQTVTSSGFVTILDTPEMTVNDKMTLPDGAVPVIHRVEKYTDEVGLNHSRVYFS